MGCGFSKFGATTDEEVGSTFRIKPIKQPLEKIVERSNKWRVDEQRRGGHRRDNSLSQKFLEESSSSEDHQASGLDDDISIIMPQTQSNHGLSAGVERKVQGESGNNDEKPREEEGKQREEIVGMREEVLVIDRHRHPRSNHNDNAGNGRNVVEGGDETDEEEDYNSDERQDSITFQGSPSFKEYCTLNNGPGHEDNRKHEEEEGRRRGKKVAGVNGTNPDELAEPP